MTYFNKCIKYQKNLVNTNIPIKLSRSIQKDAKKSRIFSRGYAFFVRMTSKRKRDNEPEEEI
jgi:hypothetical protein